MIMLHGLGLRDLDVLARERVLANERRVVPDEQPDLLAIVLMALFLLAQMQSTSNCEALERSRCFVGPVWLAAERQVCGLALGLRSSLHVRTYVR